MRAAIALTQVLVMTVGTVIGQGGCFLAPCTLIGCGSPIKIEVSGVRDPARYLGATVTLCHEDRCGSSVLGEDLPEPNTGLGGTTSGDLQLAAYLWNRDGYHLNIGLGVYTPADFTDGDTITLRIVGYTGATILEEEWTAEFSESYPNGERCDDVPCKSHERILSSPW
ncbi:MAG: hypothetical protein ACKV2T_41235 [Kofleriaceae bacterium]